MIDSTIQAKALLTEQVFTPGLAMFIRFERFGTKFLLPANCQGYSAPSGVLIVSWSSQAAERGEPPDAGTNAHLLALHQGVLYTLPARVLDHSEGKLPRVRLQADKQCIGVNLRKHPRVEVTARFCFGEAGKHMTFFQNVPRLINLSLGGFGGEIPSKSWTKLERLSYRLELFSEPRPTETTGPSMILEGYAAVRKVIEQEGSSLIYLGCQFEDMSLLQVTELELWLAAYASGQRAN